MYEFKLRHRLPTCCKANWFKYRHIGGDAKSMEVLTLFMEIKK